MMGSYPPWLNTGSAVVCSGSNTFWYNWNSDPDEESVKQSLIIFFLYEAKKMDKEQDFLRFICD